MRNLGFSFFVLLVVAGMTLACGTSSTPPERLLQSVTVSPAAADAHDFPGGKVQFTATGYFSAPPSPESPLGTFWQACYQGASTSGVSIDQNSGVAQCAAGAVGTYTVFTENYSNAHGGCEATSACGGGCFVTGTAQLTCP